MNEITINFEFGIDLEIARVKRTLNDKKWLDQNSYRFNLPSTIKNFENITEELIRQSIEAEYNKKDYETAKRAILKSWVGNCQNIRKINDKIEGSHKLNELEIILTKYGTQGSYQMPNKMIINIFNIPPEFLIKTVIHESFHLMLESLIKKYEVEHWVKERIIDLMMDLEYKSRFKMQVVPTWALAIDKDFKLHYPGIMPIMESARKISLES